MSIEQLCKSYPGVPKSVILKMDAVRLGVRFTQAAREAVQAMNLVFKGYTIFSQDRDHAVVGKEKLPRWFKLESDDTRVRIGLGTTASPYVIDQTDGKFVFCDETGVVENISFDPAPKWINQTFEDGTPFQAVAQPIGDSLLGIMTFVCDRWTRNEQCLYCDIGSFLKEKTEKDKKIVGTNKPERLAEVVDAAYREPGTRHLSISSGSIVDKKDGKSEIEFYLTYLNAINERINGNWMSSFVAIQPKKKDEIKMLHATGAPALMLNLEVWDPQLFKVLCPGKASLIGQKEMIRRVIEAVDVYGKGRILSNFVAGVEMAQPGGFKDALSAVKSTLGGFDYLMAHGVLPRTSVWVPEVGSRLGEQQVPPLKYFIELGRGYLELRQKHNFPFPFYGFCRGCYIHDPTPEWDHYFWGKAS